jgi:hypothetical protein
MLASIRSIGSLCFYFFILSNGFCGWRKSDFLVWISLASEKGSENKYDCEKHTIRMVLNSLCWISVSILVIYFSFIEHYLALFYILTSHNHSRGLVNSEVDMRVDVL